MDSNGQLIINETLVRQLVTNQFPQWKDLPVQSVEPQGWGNRAFRLGDRMSVRLPSGEEYVRQVHLCYVRRISSPLHAIKFNNLRDVPRGCLSPCSHCLTVDVEVFR